MGVLLKISGRVAAPSRRNSIQRSAPPPPGQVTRQVTNRMLLPAHSRPLALSSRSPQSGTRSFSSAPPLGASGLSLPCHPDRSSGAFSPSRVQGSVASTPRIGSCPGFLLLFSLSPLPCPSPLNSPDRYSCPLITCPLVRQSYGRNSRLRENSYCSVENLSRHFMREGRPCSYPQNTFCSPRRLCC